MSAPFVGMDAPVLRPGSATSFHEKIFFVWISKNNRPFNHNDRFGIIGGEHLLLEFIGVGERPFESVKY